MLNSYKEIVEQFLPRDIYFGQRIKSITEPEKLRFFYVSYKNINTRTKNIIQNCFCLSEYKSLTPRKM